MLAQYHSRELVWEGWVAKSEWPILLPAHPLEKSTSNAGCFRCRLHSIRLVRGQVPGKPESRKGM
jgi:hypothetical protein